MILGIDAFNLRDGGGVTHIRELLSISEPLKYGFTKFVIFGSRKSLNQLDDKPWLCKVYVPELERNFLYRAFWHVFKLKRAAMAYGCDIMFSPGGIAAHRFSPCVTMCRNMLPFEYSELKRYGFSLTFFKLLLVRIFQIISFRKCAGLIYLTDYARATVSPQLGVTKNKVVTISHGINKKDFSAAFGKDRLDFPKNHKIEVIYVSSISPYKHHDFVIKGILKLINKGHSLRLNLIGGDGGSLKLMQDFMREEGISTSSVNYIGKLSHTDLIEYYRLADVAIFASTCENMPNILLEKMASGIPVACSMKGPMQEVLGSAGIYFEVGDLKSMCGAIEKILNSREQREEMIKQSKEIIESYSWEKCSRETLNFLVDVASEYAK